MSIVNAKFEDLPQIATIHKERFSDHFLGHFNKKLIARYYSYFIKNNAIFLVHINTQNTIDGFVMGGKSSILSVAISNFVHRNLLLIGLKIIITPSLWKYAIHRIKTILHKYHKSKGNVVKVPDTRLLSIAVTKNVEGAGISILLVDNFEEHVKNKIREDKYGLSVHLNNSRAINFYKKNGFSKDTIIHNLLLLSKQL